MNVQTVPVRGQSANARSGRYHLGGAVSSADEPRCPIRRKSTKPAAHEWMPRVASSHVPESPFQPCAAEEPNGEICGGQHGDHPEECPLGGRNSMQVVVVKTAKDKKAAQHEQSAGDTE